MSPSNTFTITSKNLPLLLIISPHIHMKICSTRKFSSVWIFKRTFSPFRGLGPGTSRVGPVHHGSSPLRRVVDGGVEDKNPRSSLVL